MSTGSKLCRVMNFFWHSQGHFCYLISCIPLDHGAVPLSRLAAFRLSGIPIGRRPTEASRCCPTPTAGDADAIVLATAVADMAAAVAAACGVDGRCSGLKIDATGRLGLRVDAGRRALLWCAVVVLLLLLFPAGFTVTGRYGAETNGRGSGRTGPGLVNKKFTQCQYRSITSPWLPFHHPVFRNWIYRYRIVLLRVVNPSESVFYSDKSNSDYTKKWGFYLYNLQEISRFVSSSII